MAFDPETAAIRFGTGLSPLYGPPVSVDAMLGGVRGLDLMAKLYPVAGFSQIDAVLPDYNAARRLRRKQPNSAAGKTAETTENTLRTSLRAGADAALKVALVRSVATPQGFGERLARFWADHFTVVGKKGLFRYAVSGFVEDAIRPHVSGRFADMLSAATLHPMMLLYLDQVNSAGPNSMAARKRQDGLNENLAREVLELHSLGVTGPYSQHDVYELARLLAGASYRTGRGFVFSKGRGEPGVKTVLGLPYGDGWAEPDDIKLFLENLALHPGTARHLAHKLAVHFIGPTPDPVMVENMATAYLAHSGDLMALYRTMLDHPSAWQVGDEKAKPPFDFMVSSLRALGVAPAPVLGLDRKSARTYITSPLAVMGQPWQRPNGPDGWPETLEDWITPQGLAGRIQWAMTVPRALQPALPDPREFVDVALADRASPALQFAAQNAETTWEGVGLVLASPEFQRR